MATAVEIANMALMLCGAESITALSDSTERARACNTAWPFVRRSVLAQHAWNGPTKRAELDPDATAPSWGFDNRYALPSDCLRVLEFDTLEEWRIEDGFILTDEASDDVGIKYIYDDTDPSDFDPLLTDTLALFLAHSIMYRVNADKAYRDRIEGQMARFLAEAKSIDGMQQTDVEIEEDTWISCRG